MDLTDEQWAILKPLIPKHPRSPDNRGRPRKDSRAVLDGVLWILKTGARWQDLPKTYPPYQMCHRRFQQWVMAGVMERILRGFRANGIDHDSLLHYGDSHPCIISSQNALILMFSYK